MDIDPEHCAKATFCLWRQKEMENAIFLNEVNSNRICTISFLFPHVKKPPNPYHLLPHVNMISCTVRKWIVIHSNWNHVGNQVGLYFAVIRLVVALSSGLASGECLLLIPHWRRSCWFSSSGVDSSMFSQKTAGVLYQTGSGAAGS